ncbi:unnamed protein product [Adineta ricciae]|uniref:U-box domain-containing protein n=1 Tax=Adineta ricciae TaxID=249248 RepID=A0A815FI22_ADIRI|nr:unnamed protein product [Adineta ricciae]CAF1511949.1 unnamed protein product [Adineta ricciae]
MTEETDLVCPITLEIFRNPVKATDGHIYERDAIEKWIVDHGTSPITRETLKINELIPQNELKRICLEKRKLSVSYDPNEEKVTLPRLNYIVTNTIRINPLNNQQQSNFNLTNLSNPICFFLILFSFIFPISFLIGITQGLTNSFVQDVDVSTTYSDTLSTNDSIYTQNGTIYPGNYSYKTIEIVISTNGFYGLEIQSQSSTSIDGFLYKNSFNSSDLSMNLVSLIYKDKKYSQTYLGNYFFQTDKYILMITTYFCCQYGPFQILITGPNSVLFR